MSKTMQKTKVDDMLIEMITPRNCKAITYL